MAERSNDWWAQACRDLDAARAQRAAGFHEWACFAAQQAAEKATKAVYERLGARAWGHTLTDLLRGLRDRLDVPDEVLDCGRRLDRFYVTARCPNGWESGAPFEFLTEEDADRAVADSAQILRCCDRVLAGPRGGDPGAAPRR